MLLLKSNKTKNMFLFLISLLLIFFSFLKAEASSTDFILKTGYYIGNGNILSISGLGFTPQLVIIKADSLTTPAVFKTSAMPSPNVSYFTNLADDTTNQIEFNTNGFTVKNSSIVNSLNVRYTYIAFGNSNCTATGTFCVGYYIGDGTSSRKITTGFQPDFIIVKTSGASASFRTSQMATNTAAFFDTTASNTTGQYFQTIESDGFKVGLLNNQNLTVYYYIAFKNIPGKLNVGVFTGNGADNRDITGIGFKPDFVILKNFNALVSAVYNINESYGDYSSFFVGAVNASNHIQLLLSDGFQVGNSTNVNASGQTIHYIAFGGAIAPSSSGKFKIKTGYYIGNGTTQSITGLGFSPDLVIIKQHTNPTPQYAVFRTKLMKGDNTAYFGLAAANFSGGIISLDNDGFTVGNSPAVNALSSVYYYVAFGNAWNPETNSGSSNFIIGAYTGNGIDNRDIFNLPFGPDMITIKSTGATVATWRSILNSGDFSNFFNSSVGSSDLIQNINTSTNSFQIGANAIVNSAGTLYHYFGFKISNDFKLGQYVGTGVSQDINLGTFRPEFLWIKAPNTAVSGVLRTAAQTGDAVQPFINANTLTGGILDILSDGFRLGNINETNGNLIVYHYAAWQIPDEIPPVISEISSVPTFVNTSTPQYVFFSSEPGTIIYGGSCTSSITTATTATNTIILGPLSDGTYSDCTIQVKDFADNLSNILTISTFTVDTIPPQDPTSTPPSGTYTNSINVTLTATGSDYIRFTTDGSNPSCSSGNLYSEPITVNSSITIKAIACDNAGNFSNISVFSYVINTPPISSGGGGGGGSGGGGVISPSFGPNFEIYVKEGIKVKNRNITIGFKDVYNASYVMISENPDFKDANWLEYKNEIPYLLSENYGEKNLYIKFKSYHNIESTVYKKTIYLEKEEFIPISTTTSLIPTTTAFVISKPEIVEKYQHLKEKLQQHPLKNELKNFRFKKVLKEGMRNKDVKYLQIILNLDNDTKVRDKGPGSFTNETEYFGRFTKQAVIKFQEKYKEDILKPINKDKGTGIVGIMTIMKLNEILEKITK